MRKEIRIEVNNQQPPKDKLWLRTDDNNNILGLYKYELGRWVLLEPDTDKIARMIEEALTDYYTREEIDKIVEDIEKGIVTTITWDQVQGKPEPLSEEDIKDLFNN